jgi:S-adenosylmethionine hydrolase
LIVTLLTDFGTRDYFVGAMKGAILSVNADAQIVDLTHECPPQNVRTAGFTLFAAHPTYPQQTIHLAIVDPGVGSTRRAIVAVTENSVFVAPDNGILSFIYWQAKTFKVFQITNDKYFRKPISATFHGRDIFAPIAGVLSLGIKPEEIGLEISDFVRFEIARPQQSDENTIAAEILHIDHFGNCITNIIREDLPKKFLEKGFSLVVNQREVTKHLDFYAQATEKEIFTIWGSANFLEIVAFKASAANLLQIGHNQSIELKII